MIKTMRRIIVVLMVLLYLPSGTERVEHFERNSPDN